MTARGRRDPLPVDAVLADLVRAARERAGAVLVAPTGSGKTTRVPPALLDGLATGEVWLVEPRRIAARAAARRIAFERGQALGDEIGYSVRDDRVGGARTRLWCVTEGVLLRRLVDDPLLDGIAAVVFDEFHERRLDADLALALCRRVRDEVRPDLVIAALSATLDAGPLAEYLDVPALESAGRRFPVDVRHLPARPAEALEDAVLRAVEAERAARAPHERDVLVFLPGVGEIRRTARRLAPLARAAGFELAELYGDLPAAAQDRLFERGAAPRIVLATNVAETSITLPDVAAVIDSGFARVLRHDPGTGLDRLVLARISRASADQRAGRAGRAAPGRAWRLWSEPEHRALAERETPEVAALDLAGAVLQLVAFGEGDPRRFPWFEAPPAASLDAAEDLLVRLGAVRSGPAGLVTTAIGASLARLPLSPRLGRLVLAGAERGVAREASLAAALLAERDPFRRAARSVGADPFADALDSDVFERVRALDAFQRGGGDVDRVAADVVLRAATRIERAVSGVRARSRPKDENEREDALARALLAAYPERVARRRAPGAVRALMVGGRGVELLRESRVTEAELFVAVELEGAAAASAEARVRQASAIDPSWLDPDLIAERDDLAFDASKGRVVALRKWLYIDLPLDERPVPPDPERATALLLAEAARDPVRAFGLARDDVVAWRARVAFLAQHCPELGLPALLDADVAGLLAESVPPGTTSFAELAALPVAELLAARLTGSQRAALERDAPTGWTVPAGRRARIEYPAGRAPFLAARIQELFGLVETPRLAGGRVALVVHLLAPNHRAEQVTDDLASFWRTTYPAVRQTLRRRYPRHAWPEDPTRAAPTGRPRPRGG